MELPTHHQFTKSPPVWWSSRTCSSDSETMHGQMQTRWHRLEASIIRTASNTYWQGPPQSYAHSSWQTCKNHQSTSTNRNPEHAGYQRKTHLLPGEKCSTLQQEAQNCWTTTSAWKGKCPDPTPRRQLGACNSNTSRTRAQKLSL